MSIALTAAETGHLVLTTCIHPVLQKPSTGSGCLPAIPAPAVRLQLSTTLEAILYQSLIPRADGTGVIRAVEVLIATPESETLSGKPRHTRCRISCIRAGCRMRTLDQALTELHQRGLSQPGRSLFASTRQGNQLPEQL